MVFPVHSSSSPIFSPSVMKSVLFAVTLLFAICAVSQSDPTYRSWNQPVEPFHIVGNIYYVGASDIASYLITSPEGYILLDGGFVETAPMIRDNIRKLGFNPKEVKYLLNSHAHSDHAAGLAQLKEWTGARLVASQEDGELLARGGHGDFAWGDKLTFPAVQPDRTIRDGGTVEIGGNRMTAHLTPGHTKGCTTWTTEANENGHSYHVVFYCSTSAPGYNLVHNPNYPNIVEDYRKSFAYLEKLPCDVFLAPHGSFFGLTEKRAALKADPDHNPFIDSAEYKLFLNQSRKDFEKELKKQQEH
jgi:metallo-beta-lactamase class B